LDKPASFGVAAAARRSATALEGYVPASLESLVSELSDDVVLLSQSYAAWLQLVHPEQRAPYAEVLERFSSFFEPTALAHFLSVVVTTYQLTDERSDVVSVWRVLERAQNSYPEVAREVGAMLAPSRQIFERIASIRLKVYAHRDGRVGPEMIFREANLTPELIGSCMSLLQFAVDALAVRCVPGCVAGAVVTRATHAADRTRGELRTMLAAL